MSAAAPTYPSNEKRRNVEDLFMNAPLQVAQRSKLVRPKARSSLTSLSYWPEWITGLRSGRDPIFRHHSLVGGLGDADTARHGRTRRLYEQIARKLAKAIADGKYELGQRLPSERELAQTFDVSRPTVREAIIALELDELVDVRLGSGVYVKNRQPPGGTEGAKDIGPFELLEARRAIEGEACALAALRIDDAQLEQLSELIAEMRDDNRHNEILMSEDADRRFHELIASSTQNSGIIAAVQMLWDARARSPQSHSMDDKGRARGLQAAHRRACGHPAGAEAA